MSDSEYGPELPPSEEEETSLFHETALLIESRAAPPPPKEVVSERAEWMLVPPSAIPDCELFNFLVSADKTSRKFRKRPINEDTDQSEWTRIPNKKPQKTTKPTTQASTTPASTTQASTTQASSTQASTHAPSLLEMHKAKLVATPSSSTSQFNYERDMKISSSIVLSLIIETPPNH